MLLRRPLGSIPTLCTFALAVGVAYLSSTAFLICVIGNSSTRQSSHRWQPATLRRASGNYNRQKLEEEASFTAGVVKSVQDLFKPKVEEPSQEELDARARREESSQATLEALRSLKLSVLAGTDDDGRPQRRAAPISVLQSQAKQSLVIFAAVNEQLLTDLVLSMRIAANDFAQRNLIVVPALVSLEQKLLIDLPEKLRNTKLMSQGSVAFPALTAEGAAAQWGSLLADEFREADEQGMGEQARRLGLALVLGRDGDLRRRGVGRPNWEVVFKEVDAQ